MAWWQEFLPRTEKGKPSQVEFPVQFELILEKLWTRVHLHDANTRDGPVPCWTYVTDGLSAQGHKELILSLRRDPGEKPADLPRPPLDFFAAVYRFAEQGQVVDVGDFSEMAAPNFLGHKGLLYIPPEAEQNVEGLDDALAAILLTEEELEAVKAFGPTRVMARLGHASRYYPCPFWSDRTRPGLPFARSMQESILTRAPHLWMRGISAYMEGDLITLRLLPQVREHLQSELDRIPPDVPLTLLTNLDPAARGCLFWEPGQSQVSAITPSDSDGARLCGCFVLFVPGQPADGVKVVEDGFGMALTDASWAALRDALATGQPISIPAADRGMRFQVEWVPTSYCNPVNGLVYHSEAGWETYGPTVPQDKGDTGVVDTKHIVLLTHDAALCARIGIESLAAYAQAIEKAVRDHFALLVPGDGQDLTVQFEVWPGGKVEVALASRPGIAGVVLGDLHTALLALPAPAVTQDAIKFQLVFAIWGGTDDA